MGGTGLKLTFITNACCIYEHEGFKLLCDPWLTEPAFDTWVHDPPLETLIEDVLGVDALYISHIHPDHLDPETLKHFRKDIPIITLKDKLSLADRRLRELEFNDVVAIADRHMLLPLTSAGSKRFGPFTITMFGPFTKHPFHDSEIGNVVDSALLIEAGGFKILNTNDNTPSIEAAKWLREEYGPIDVAQLNFNNAGPYPACFDNLTDKEKLAEAKRCVQRNLDHMVAVARELRPVWVMPFAGAYKLAYGLEHLNPYLGTCTPQEAAAYLKDHKIEAFAMEEGEVSEFR